MQTHISSGKLIIVRHHESEWNKKGLWTGVQDVDLTPYGFRKSEEMGQLFKDICVHYAFTSSQIRSIETLSSMLSVCTTDENLPIEHISAFNERDYGDYTGKNKWDMEKLLGEEEFLKLRRSWNYPLPNGETLEMVYNRSVPFFVETIVPLLAKGNNVLIVSHGNVIRCLMKYIENISDDIIGDIEAPFGSILIYVLNENGHMVTKEIRSVPSEVNA